MPWLVREWGQGRGARDNGFRVHLCFSSYCIYIYMLLYVEVCVEYVKIWLFYRVYMNLPFHFDAFSPMELVITWLWVVVTRILIGEVFSATHSTFFLATGSGIAGNHPKPRQCAGGGQKPMGRCWWTSYVSFEQLLATLFMKGSIPEIFFTVRHFNPRPPVHRQLFYFPTVVLHWHGCFFVAQIALLETSWSSLNHAIHLVLFKWFFFLLDPTG